MVTAVPSGTAAKDHVMIISPAKAGRRTGGAYRMSLTYLQPEGKTSEGTDIVKWDSAWYMEPMPAASSPRQQHASPGGYRSVSHARKNGQAVVKN
jgi:hypothetical protein